MYKKYKSLILKNKWEYKDFTNNFKNIQKNINYILKDIKYEKIDILL